MIETKPLNNSLAAKSPFELRVNLGRDVPESDVRKALGERRHGFSSFLHYRLHRRWAGRSRGCVDGRLPLALPVLPQSGHMDYDQRHPCNAGQGNRRAAQISITDSKSCQVGLH